MSNIAVIGAGYVGLTTAACFAHLGHAVICADVNAERVAQLCKGEIPILEDGLQALVTEGLEAGRLSFVVGAAEAARRSEFVFLCVPTPQGDDGAADLSYVEAVAREIAPVLLPRTVIANKSTMPVGSTRMVQRVLESAGAGLHDVSVTSNPEFLREGTAVHDFLEPARIVIGCDDADAAVRFSKLYAKLDAPIVITDPASAEMIKYASNAFLATKISFVNAVANLCEAVGADVREVTIGMGHDPRIGFEFLHPGPGYGGSCFPKDTAALLHTAERAGYDFSLLRGVVEVNERQQTRMVEKVRGLAAGTLEGVRVAVLGLTFKADTDDLRDSPSLVVIDRLLEAGAIVRAYDPSVAPAALLGMPLKRSPLDRVEILADPYEACDGADVLAVLTEWDEFRWLDFARVRDSMTGAAVLDARNILEPQAMRRLGFTYEGVGR